jgi:hypothetical protein
VGGYIGSAARFSHMRATVHNYPAEKARQGEIILRRPWQKIVFFGGLVVPILWLLFALLFPAAGH